MAPDLYPSFKGELFPVFCLREFTAIFSASHRKLARWLYDSSEGVIYFALAEGEIIFLQVVRDLGESTDATGAVWRGARLLTDEEIPLTRCPEASFLDLLSKDVIRNNYLVNLWRDIAAAAEFFGASVQAVRVASPQMLPRAIVASREMLLS